MTDCSSPRACVADLRALGNPTVNAALSEWEHGGFCSFEQALVTLVRVLAEQNNVQAARIDKQAGLIVDNMRERAERDRDPRLGKPIA